MAFFARITRAVAPAAIAFGGVSALAFCDEGKYVWSLRGSHTVRVLASEQLARISGVDDQVAAYFADREADIELPEKAPLGGDIEDDAPPEPASTAHHDEPDGDHVWVLKGSHTVRVLAEERAAVLESIDARVAKYFSGEDEAADQNEEEEEAGDEDEAEAEAEAEAETEEAAPSNADAGYDRDALIAQLMKRIEALESKKLVYPRCI